MKSYVGLNTSEYWEGFLKLGWIRRTRIEVVATLSELVGYKAGLALTKQDIVNHLPEERELWAGSEDDTIRLHSSTYQELLTRLLYCHLSR
jgi:hypothetical protein